MSKNVEFEPFAKRCYGLDVLKKEIVAIVEDEGITRETKSFASMTRLLQK